MYLIRDIGCNMYLIRDIGCFFFINLC